MNEGKTPRTPEGVIWDELVASRRELISNNALTDRIMRALSAAGYSVEDTLGPAGTGRRRTFSFEVEPLEDGDELDENEVQGLRAWLDSALSAADFCLRILDVKINEEKP